MDADKDINTNKYNIIKMNQKVKSEGKKYIKQYIKLILNQENHIYTE